MTRARLLFACARLLWWVGAEARAHRMQQRARVLWCEALHGIAWVGAGRRR